MRGCISEYAGVVFFSAVREGCGCGICRFQTRSRSLKCVADTKRTSSLREVRLLSTAHFKRSGNDIHPSHSPLLPVENQLPALPHCCAWRRMCGLNTTVVKNIYEVPPPAPAKFWQETSVCRLSEV